MPEVLPLLGVSMTLLLSPVSVSSSLSPLCSHLSPGEMLSLANIIAD